MNEEQDQKRWKEVGERLRAARVAQVPNMSKRAAARKAGFSEIIWRQLENGRRQVNKGLFVTMSASDSTLEAAARAVDIDPAELFKLVGRPYVPTAPPPAKPEISEERFDAMEAAVRMLSAQVRVLNERLDQVAPPTPKEELDDLVDRGRS